MDRSLAHKDVIKKEPFMKVVAQKADFWISYFCGSDFEFVTDRVRPAYLKELEKFHQSESFKLSMAQASKTAYDKFAEDIRSKGAAALKKVGTLNSFKDNIDKNAPVPDKNENQRTDANTDNYKSGTTKTGDQNINKTVSFSGTIVDSQDFQNPDASSTQNLDDCDDLNLTVEDMDSMEAAATAILKKKESFPVKTIKTEKPEKNKEPPKKIPKKA